MRAIAPALALGLMALAAGPSSAGLLDGGKCGGGLLGGVVGGIAGGCPIVESRPGVVQGIVTAQQVEIVLQTAHMVTQIENLIAMRRLSALDTAAAVAGRLTGVVGAVRMEPRVRWGVGAADADFRQLYPDALPGGWDAAALAAHQGEQARLARAASRASKLATADAVTAVGAYPARVRGLVSALKACEGQSCAADTTMQAALLGAELAAQALVVQAAHHRAQEAQADLDQAAVERARLHRLINWRDAESYGGS